MSSDETVAREEKSHPPCIGFHNEFEKIQEIISMHRSGTKQNVAILGLPYSGRSTLLTTLREEYKDSSYFVEYGSWITKKRKLLESRYSQPIVFIDGCQYLFSRRIGGFSVLDDFLEEVASSSSLFITTWNLYAWNYIRRVREVERFFPKIIRLPPLSDTEMRQCILKDYTEAELQFIGDVDIELPSLLRFTPYPVKLPWKSEPVELPLPRVNIDRVSLRRHKKEMNLSDEELVFQKITKMAGGNPGVGKAIWKKSFEYPTVNLKDYTPMRMPDPLLRNDAFILGIIAMTGSITREELEEAAGGEYPICPTLYRLLSLEVIMKVNGGYQIYPEALLLVNEMLLKLRIFWE
ncbi:hypothetical protein RJ53_02180 [Methanocalculus chunghsingensis]|uniref:ATP-binding protein n=1 Tax=Methanocalculus chunghsingensis TaxID=156457 RepID=A0A8J8B4S3_9EURY|nr:ATP-binding protein [Methanocalculus chunghsingensis]MBR1368368.1 hypothetical protein [Methanocalculus chunghsingensis]